MITSSHYALKQKIEFPISITTLSPLHIGQSDWIGNDESIAEVMKFQKDQENIPYIPGSTIKGVFRTHLERILRNSKLYYACDPISHSCSGDLKLKTSKADSGLCLACFMFGNTQFKGEISFTDFLPDSNVNLLQKTSTAITRDNGVAKRGALRTVECISPRTKFYGKIIINSDNLLYKGYLAAVIQDLNRQFITIGAFGSKGFGEIKIDAKKYLKWSPGEINPEVVEIDSLRKTLRKFIDEMEESN